MVFSSDTNGTIVHVSETRAEPQRMLMIKTHYIWSSVLHLVLCFTAEREGWRRRWEFLVMQRMP